MALDTARRKIQHLLRRAGWGYSPSELNEYLALGLKGSIERLLSPDSVDDSASQALIAGLEADPNQDRGALIAAWHLRIITTKRPLLERMTYFWHDHFATAVSKVESPAFMQAQNDMFRTRAFGRFDEMLTAVARDAAMMVFLDNSLNVRTAPNENFARELMELHTLGEGNVYTEKDIKEAARALTGWRITTEELPKKPQGKQFPKPTGAVLVPNRFDSGKKTFLGVTGNLNDQNVILALAALPETAQFVGRKLWRYFATEPTAEMLARTTKAYFDSKYSMREVVRTILTSDEMYSEGAYRWRIKSPVEYVLGYTRSLGLVGASGRTVTQMRAMNQTLYEPPGPQGWSKGGADWIASATMLARANFAYEVTRSDGPRAQVVDAPAMLRTAGLTASAAQIVDGLADLLVGGDLDPQTRQTLIDYLGGEAHFTFADAQRNGALHGVLYLMLSMPLAHLA
ncbi:MAG: DUF1800 domain-containing protein [Dehalococcoidia bacterium]|nr:DUF1800 domain-containing protein [Dehalococcoidia bacterium]